jgi:5-methyltetrahydropteroyltriglutamate--homocysteine methyltransferase
MIDAHLNGVFPRSEELIQITRAAARGRASQSEVDVLVRKETQDLGALQKAAGFGFVTDGQLSWQDLFRPFSTLLTGIEPGGVTRWFDNNTFYRKPIIKERPRYRSSDIQKYFHSVLLPSDAAKKAVLPGPVTFALMSENMTTASLADLVDDLAHAIRDLVSELSKAGYTFFQFNEPILCSSNVKKGDLELAAKAFDVLSNGVQGIKCLQTYFGDASCIMSALLDFPVDYIGVDLYATPIDRLREFDFSKGLGCGCLDGRNSLLESTQDLVKLISEIKEKVEPDKLYACPSCDLEYLPYPIAEKKLQILSSVMREAV